MRSWSNLSYFAGIGLEELKKKPNASAKIPGWSPAENFNWNLSEIKQDYNPFGRNIRFYDADLRVIISGF
jgi:hypothetical protein